jgi:hypothetical protein
MKMFNWFRKKKEIPRPVDIDEDIWELLRVNFIEDACELAYRTERWRLLEWRTLEQAVKDGDKEKALSALYSFTEGAFI